MLLILAAQTGIMDTLKKMEVNTMNNFLKLTGDVSAASFCGLAVKYPLRKMKMHKLNAELMKAHEPISGVFFLAASAHLAAGLMKAKKTAPAVVISGAAAYAVSFVLIAACHMTKDAQKKMRWHRIYSLFLTLTAAGHVTAAAALKKN